MVNKNWFQKRLKVSFNMWWCPWCGRHNSFAFFSFGKIASRKILANFVRLEFNQNRGLYKLNKVTSKVLWFKTGHSGWLRIKRKSKTQIWTHTAQPQTSEIVMFFLAKMDIHPTLPNTLSNIPDFRVSTVILNIIDISRRWCKLSFGLLSGKVKSHHFP